MAFLKNYYDIWIYSIWFLLDLYNFLFQMFAQFHSQTYFWILSYCSSNSWLKYHTMTACWHQWKVPSTHQKHLVSQRLCNPETLRQPQPTKNISIDWTTELLYFSSYMKINVIPFFQNQNQTKEQYYFHWRSLFS